MPAEAIWVILLNATAVDGNVREVGREYRLNLLVNARSREDAMERALFALSGNYWSDGEVVKIGKLTVESGEPPEDYLRKAIEDAQRTGVAFVIYES